jgi:phosphoglycolate phosphatase
MHKLIVFDLDGTLIDSIPDLTAAINHMRSGFGLSLLSQGEVTVLVGEGARRLVEDALPGFSPEEQQQGLECFLEYNFKHIVDETRLYPGVIETLQTLQERGYILTVASNKSEPHCKEILRLLKVEHYFSAVLGAESASERKPSPAPLFQLMQQFGVTSGETVMVGDSINDVKAGKSAGVLTIGCEFGYGTDAELAGADCTITSLEQVVTLLSGAGEDKR